MIKINLLLDGKQIRKYKLIYYLYYHQGSLVSIATLSDLFKVSKKTIFADLTEIEKKNHAFIDKIPITLKIIKGNVEFKFSDKASILEIRQYFFEESLAFKLLNSFYKQGYFKMMDFSSNYYYSVSVIYKKINELKSKLNHYDLTIQSEQRRTFLAGDEEKKRFFYSELYYYVYGNRSSFLDPEKEIAQNYFKQIDKNEIVENAYFQKNKKIKLYILIAVSLQRMKKFPLIKEGNTYFYSNILMGKEGQLLLEEQYPDVSKDQLKLEHQWMVSFINGEIDPCLSIESNSLFFKGLTRIASIFKFDLTSQEGKLFKQMMLMYHKNTLICKKDTILPQLSFQNGISIDISSNLFLEVLIKENNKEEFEYSIYPISLEECATVLKISGVGIEKLRLTFISELPLEWEIVLYRKILTIELEKFYEWSDDLSKSDVIIADTRYSFIDGKKLLLISPVPSDEEINTIQKQLISHLNQTSEVRDSLDVKTIDNFKIK